MEKDEKILVCAIIAWRIEEFSWNLGGLRGGFNARRGRRGGRRLSQMDFGHGGRIREPESLTWHSQNGSAL
jgi:hypothetical protein